MACGLSLPQFCPPAPAAGDGTQGLVLVRQLLYPRVTPLPHISEGMFLPALLVAAVLNSYIFLIPVLMLVWLLGKACDLLLVLFHSRKSAGVLIGGAAWPFSLPWLSFFFP